MKTTMWILFIVGYIIVTVVAQILSRFIIPDALCWKEPIAGAIAAIIVVLYSFVAAPKLKMYVALAGYLLGVFLVYQILDMRWYPECHVKAYTSTMLPIISTYISGLVTLVVIWVYSKYKRNKFLHSTTSALIE
jgi:hypothetical protein